MTVYLRLNTCNFLTQKRAGAEDLSFTDCINKFLKNFICSSIANSRTESSKIFPQVTVCRIQHNCDTHSSELQLLFRKATALCQHSRKPKRKFSSNQCIRKGLFYSCLVLLNGNL